MSEQTLSEKIAHRAENYWVQSRRPVVSLVFVAPLMVIYEAGVVFCGVQNGADAWMRQFLDFFGFGQHLLLPLLTAGVLVAWHYLSHEPWRFSPAVLWPMFVESLLLAICLRILLVLQSAMFVAVASPTSMSIASQAKSALGFLGAGIYEELLFRLLLLTGINWLVRRWYSAPQPSLVLAVLLSSLIFAAAHYVGQAGDPFQWFSFWFRFVAGVFFSILFIYRGFGIAAGAHAAYDILAGLF
ncbi:MAG: CPBP family glutamic-type intramembrane protease [Thermoguttaceae bacterium]